MKTLAFAWSSGSRSRLSPRLPNYRSPSSARISCHRRHAGRVPPAYDCRCLGDRWSRGLRGNKAAIGGLVAELQQRTISEQRIAIVRRVTDAGTWRHLHHCCRIEIKGEGPPPVGWVAARREEPTASDEAYQSLPSVGKSGVLLDDGMLRRQIAQDGSRDGWFLRQI